MKRQRVIIVFIAVLLVLGLWWLLRLQSESQELLGLSNGSAASSPPQGAFQEPQTYEEHEARKEEKKREVVGQIISSLNTPIEFYGKVVDQNGDPVPNAYVGYGLLDKFNDSGSNGRTYADASGYITIGGVKGAAIRVSVNKEGYYRIHNVSNQVFGYGSKPPPTKDNPAIFVLHKMGETEPLTFVSGRQFDVPPTGRTVSIDLATGGTSNGAFQIASWLGDVSQRPFDWHYQLNIPGGGLIERKGQFDFEAPENGYEESVEINMPTTAEKWSSRLEKNYFAKLPDGKYARFKIRFYPGSQRNFVVLESYVNPTPGSRNLEYDPKQTVKAP